MLICSPIRFSQFRLHDPDVAMSVQEIGSLTESFSKIHIGAVQCLSDNLEVLTTYRTGLTTSNSSPIFLRLRLTDQAQCILVFANSPAEFSATMQRSRKRMIHSPMLDERWKALDTE